MDTEIGPFIISVEPGQLRKEKEKATLLRGSQWWKRQIARGVCYYCQRKIPPAELTMDHIVALIRGGKFSGAMSCRRAGNATAARSTCSRSSGRRY